MPCLLAGLALFVPRFTIVLVVLFSDYIGDACRTTIWPLLGFIFMPLTTLGYAWAWHLGQGSIQGFGLAVVVACVLVDLGLVGDQARRRRRIRVVIEKGR